MNSFDFQTRMETEEFLATGKDPQPPTEPRAGITYCVICNAPFTASDATAECEEHRTPTNPRAQTATPLTPDYHRGYQEGFNEGIKHAQKFIESQSNPAPIVINTNQHDQLVAALRDVAIPTLRYCEDKFGLDDQARLNLEATLATTEQKGGE